MIARRIGHDPVNRSLSFLSVPAMGWRRCLPFRPRSRRKCDPQELSRTSPAGNYLAGRQANLMRDAAAAPFYRAALRADPRNPELLAMAFHSALAEGSIDGPSASRTACSRWTRTTVTPGS
jgi:hypothetical protein